MNDMPAKPVDETLMRDWPLPMPAHDGDKEERGRVLVIAGAREIPGAVLLAATAALRAGAGKVTVATVASIALPLALAIPEARVVELPETENGGIALAALDRLASLAPRYDAVLIGPGLQDEEATCALVQALLPMLEKTSVVLDAAAMNVVRSRSRSGEARSCIERFSVPLLMTPHAGEMAYMTGREKEAVQADPRETVLQAARRWNALIALKGATTFIASPSGQLWQHEGGNVGLATSGSGDVLAGVIAGLVARGATPQAQACSSVALHARAGNQLAQRFGMLGYRASELADEVPALMQALGSSAQA